MGSKFHGPPGAKHHLPFIPAAGSVAMEGCGENKVDPQLPQRTPFIVPGAAPSACPQLIEGEVDEVRFVGSSLA